MSEMHAPTVEDVKALLKEYFGYAAQQDGQVKPEDYETPYGEDPLAGVTPDTYKGALAELKQEGYIEEEAYDQAADKLESYA